MGTTPAAFRTPHDRWVLMDVRDDTSDWNTVNAITKVGDEYGMPEGQSGWGVDVGAHIGAWAITLLIDNPAMRCIAIEALPENVELILRNAEANGVADRLVVIHGGATDPGTRTVEVRYSTDDHHRFIGSQGGEGTVVELPGVSLLDVLAGIDRINGADRIALMKIDCEGCEYPFLQGPGLSQVDRIVGEVHHGADRLRRQLDPTHLVTVDQDFGPFSATIRP